MSEEAVTIKKITKMFANSAFILLCILDDLFKGEVQSWKKKKKTPELENFTQSIMDVICAKKERTPAMNLHTRGQLTMA